MKRWMGLVGVFLAVVALPSALVGMTMADRPFPVIGIGIGLAFVTGLAVAWKARTAGLPRSTAGRSARARRRAR